MAWTAAQQLGLITAKQAGLAGLTPRAINHRVASGRFHRVYRGAYFVGVPLAVPHVRALAAVLACGVEEALCSHASATALWGLTAEPRGDATVTVVGRSCRSREGIVVHRVASLDPRDRSLRFGIPVTSPGRTLLDYAGIAPTDELERAVAQAQALRLVDEPEIQAAIARAPRRAGAAALKRCMAGDGGPALTRSEAERLMLRIVRLAGLPAPATNVRVAGFEVDFVWPAQRLIVEVDGYQFHGHRAAFERDRRKSSTLAAAGYRVIRITWRQLVREPLLVVAQLASAIAASP